MILPAFIGLTLAWSFSWIIMKIQVDSVVPLELSVFYRFALVAVLFFVLCALTKKRLTLTKKEAPFFIFIGLFNFCLNFFAGYEAVKYIPSGVIAMIFSLSIIASEIISSFVYKRKISKKTIVSGLVGFVGLVFFILPMVKFHQDANLTSVLKGFAITLGMVLVYSIGNVLIGINKEKNATPLYTSIAYGSIIGSSFMLAICLIQGQKFVFDFSAIYVWSMAYLVIIASFLAFICLFYLIQNIGSAKANYTSLIYPPIALVTSAIFEDYQFSFYGLIGFVLIVLAIAIQFLQFEKFKEPSKNH